MPTSKSWKQARHMLEQSQSELPEGVQRRTAPEHAAQFVIDDMEAGVFYDEQGNLRPEEDFE